MKCPQGFKLNSACATYVVNFLADCTNMCFFFLFFVFYLLWVRLNRRPQTCKASAPPLNYSPSPTFAFEKKSTYLSPLDFLLLQWQQLPSLPDSPGTAWTELMLLWHLRDSNSCWSWRPSLQNSDHHLEPLSTGASALSYTVTKTGSIFSPSPGVQWLYSFFWETLSLNSGQTILWLHLHFLTLL